MNEELPFGFRNILKRFERESVKVISDEESVLLTEAYISPESLSGEEAASLLDRGLMSVEDGRRHITDLGMKGVSRYPLFGKEGQRQLYPEAFFPFLFATVASHSLPSGRWQRAISSDFFTSIFPSVDKTRVLEAASRSIGRLIELGVIKETSTLCIRRKEAEDFLRLSEEERLALIIDENAVKSGEALAKDALFIYLSSLLSSVAEEKLGEYIAVIEKLSGTRIDTEDLFVFSVLEKCDGMVSGRAFTDEETASFAVSSDFSVTYRGKTPPSLFLFLSPIMTDRTQEWKLTKESAKTAFSSGLTTAEITGSLSELSLYNIPETVESRLSLWYSSYSSIRAMRTLVLATDERNARIIDALPTLKMHIAGKLSDTVFLMNMETESLWRRALENAGFDMLGPTEGPEFAKEDENIYIPNPSFVRPSVPEKRAIAFDKKLWEAVEKSADTPLRKALALSHFIVSPDEETPGVEMINGLYYQEKMRLIKATEENSRKLYAEEIDGTVTIGKVVRTDDEHISVNGKVLETAKIWKAAMLPQSVRSLEILPSDSDSQ